MLFRSWINASADGDITISSGGTAKTRSAFTDRTVKANKLSFNGNDLYFGVSIPEEEMLSYQLPPKPPAGAFDVRFAEDMKVTESAGAIEIMNNTDMLTISYTINIDAGEHLRWVLTSDEGKEYGLLNGSGEIVVGGDITGFTLNKVPEIPLTYSISQNYPNPFNPRINLELDIVDRGVLDISIYDVNGRFISKVHKGLINPGYYYFYWDGKDEYGHKIANGAYFFHVKAETERGQIFEDIYKLAKIE